MHIPGILAQACLGMYLAWVCLFTRIYVFWNAGMLDIGVLVWPAAGQAGPGYTCIHM
jgi:hypothetical protein